MLDLVCSNLTLSMSRTPVLLCVTAGLLCWDLHTHPGSLITYKTKDKARKHTLDTQDVAFKLLLQKIQRISRGQGQKKKGWKDKKLFKIWWEFSQRFFWRSPARTWLCLRQLDVKLTFYSWKKMGNSMKRLRCSDTHKDWKEIQYHGGTTFPFFVQIIILSLAYISSLLWLDMNKETGKK